MKKDFVESYGFTPYVCQKCSVDCDNCAFKADIGVLTCVDALYAERQILGQNYFNLRRDCLFDDHDPNYMKAIIKRKNSIKKRVEEINKLILQKAKDDCLLPDCILTLRIGPAIWRNYGDGEFSPLNEEEIEAIADMLLKSDD